MIVMCTKYAKYSNYHCCLYLDVNAYGYSFRVLTSEKRIKRDFEIDHVKQYIHHISQSAYMKYAVIVQCQTSVLFCIHANRLVHMLALYKFLSLQATTMFTNTFR